MDAPPPARRLTEASRRKLNELLAEGVPLATAMQKVAAEPGAFERVSQAPPPKAPDPPPRPAWSGDSTDWQPVVEKLNRLRDLDRDCTAFGANRHRYELR